MEINLKYLKNFMEPWVVVSENSWRVSEARKTEKRKHRIYL